MTKCKSSDTGFHKNKKFYKMINFKFQPLNHFFFKENGVQSINIILIKYQTYFTVVIV